MKLEKNTSEYGAEKRTRGTSFKVLVLLLSLAAIFLVSLSLAYLSEYSAPVRNDFVAAPKYTLRYDENLGGSLETVGNMPETAENYTGVFAVSSKLPTRAGYRFLGWADTSEAVAPATELAPVYAYNGLDVNGDATLQSSVTVAAGEPDNYSKTVYAVWQKAKYTLNFNANGGSAESAPAKLEAEATPDEGSYTFIIPEQIPQHTNTNKVFLGWALTPEATVPAYAYNGLNHEGAPDVNLYPTVDVTAAMTDRSLTLYAVWGTWYTLRFDPNSALGGHWPSGTVPQDMTPQTVLVVADSHTFTIPAKTAANTPSRDGLYEFGWWGPDPDNYIETEYKHGVGITLYADDPDVTLYAFYRPLSPSTLTFYRNHTPGDMTVWNQQAGSGTDNVIPVTIGVNNPDRTNYLFLGWSEDPAATTATYKKGDTVTINRIVNYEKKLYAVWQPMHRFRVAFLYNNDWNSRPGNGVYYLLSGWANTNGGNIWYDGPQYSMTEASSYTWTASFWQQNGVYALKQNNKIADYEFLGWSYNSAGKNTAALTEEDVDIPVQWRTENGQTRGYIVQDIMFECPDEGHCVGGTQHQVNLYAVWKTTPKHYYRLVFSANDSSNSNVDNVVNKDSLQPSAHPLSDYDSRAGTGIISMLKPANTPDARYSTYDGYTKDIHDSGSLLLTYEVDSYTWTADDLNAHGPLPSKNPTATARYILDGWSFKKNDTKIDVPVDKNTGELLGDISIVHSEDYETPTAVLDETTKKLTVYVPEHAEGGEGCGHNLILYPVWRTEPLHEFRVYFLLDSQTATLHWYDEEDGWTYKQPYIHEYTGVRDIYDRDRSGYRPASSPFLYSSDVLPADQGPPAEWTEEFWTAKVYYASRPDDATTRYEFLGWAYRPRIDERGRAVYDQVDIGVDENGFLTAAPSFDDLADDCHEKDVGKVHSLVLSPVWRRIPLNSYRLVFHGNGGGTQYYQDDGTLRKNYNDRLEIINNPAVYPDGTTRNLYGQYAPVNAWYSPTILLTDENARSYTWSKDFLRERAQTAVRGDTDTHRYRFKGWAYSPDATTPDIPVDENGLITQDITITDPWNKTDQGNHFVAFLYAVWEAEEIHSYQLRFNRNTSLHYWSNNIFYYSDNHGYWRDSDNGIPVTYSSELLTRDRDSYTWDTDFWDAHGLHAWRNSEEFYDLAFLGWAKDPNATTPDYPVEWRIEDGQQRGYITQDIRFEEPHENEPCPGGVHILDLYAVYGRVLKTRTFTLSFDPNRGSGTFEAMSQTETYNGTAWAETSEPFTIPTGKPSYGSRLFAGWAETSNAASGVYGYIDHTNAKTEEATQYLQSTITYPYGNNGNKTLYAIWWNEYRLYYDGNGGSDEVISVPADELAYWSANVNSYSFTVNPEVIPQRAGYTFLGWATDENATQAEYHPAGAGGLPKKITVDAGSDGVGEATLYAVWEPVSGTNGQTNAPLMQSAAPMEGDPVLMDADAQTLPQSDYTPVDAALPPDEQDAAAEE